MDIQLNKWIIEIAFLEINGSQKYQKVWAYLFPKTWTSYVFKECTVPYFETIFRVYPNFCSISKVQFKKKIELKNFFQCY